MVPQSSVLYFGPTFKIEILPAVMHDVWRRHDFPKSDSATTPRDLFTIVCGLRGNIHWASAAAVHHVRIFFHDVDFYQSYLSRFVGLPLSLLQDPRRGALVRRHYFLASRWLGRSAFPDVCRRCVAKSQRSSVCALSRT